MLFLGALQLRKEAPDLATATPVTLVSIVRPPPVPDAQTVRPATLVRAHIVFDLPVLPDIPEVVATPEPDNGPPASAISPSARPESTAIVAFGTELAVYCPDRRSPLYPPESRRLRQQGEATLRAELDEGGRVSSVEIIKSSGYPALDAAARTAVLSWHCRPAEVGGHPVRAVAVQPIEFVLNQR